VNRRRYLVGVATIALAGCSGGDPDSASDQTTSEGGSSGSSTTSASGTTGTPSAGPETPVILHYEALDANDVEAANAAIHSESSRGPLPDSAVERARQHNYTVEQTEVFDPDTDTPEVRVVVTARNTETGETNSLERRIEVRKEGDTWKMFDILNPE